MLWIGRKRQYKSAWRIVKLTLFKKAIEMVDSLT